MIQDVLFAFQTLTHIRDSTELPFRPSTGVIRLGVCGLGRKPVEWIRERLRPSEFGVNPASHDSGSVVAKCRYGKILEGSCWVLSAHAQPAD